MTKSFKRYLKDNSVQSIVVSDPENVCFSDCDATGLGSDCFECIVTDSSGNEWDAELNRWDVADFVNAD